MKNKVSLELSFDHKNGIWCKSNGKKTILHQGTTDKHDFHKLLIKTSTDIDNERFSEKDS